MVQMVTDNDPETVTRLTNFQAANEQLRLQYKTLLEKYPDQWVAVNRNGEVVAAHSDLRSLVDMYDREEFQQGRIVVALLETEPSLLIL